MTILGAPAVLTTRGANRCDQACVDADTFDREQDMSLCECMAAANLIVSEDGWEEINAGTRCECDRGLKDAETEYACSGAVYLSLGAAFIATAALLQ